MTSPDGLTLAKRGEAAANLRDDSGGGYRVLLAFLARPATQRWLVLAAVLVFWQSASGVLFNSYYLGTPLEVVRQLAEWIGDGTLFRHLAVTISTTALGFVIAAVSGILIAIPLAMNGEVDRVLGPFIYAAFALPKVVLAPLMIFWLGVGFLPSLSMSAITGFFFVFFNAYQGLRTTSPALMNSVALMGANPLQMIVKVRLPAAAPMVLVGLHQGLIYAFHGAIVGEMTASNLGIGYVIIFATTEMNTTGVLAGLIAVASISFALTAGLYAVGRKIPGGKVEY